MTTENVVWAVQVRAGHNEHRHTQPMDECTDTCQRAHLILDEDNKAKRRGHI